MRTLAKAIGYLEEILLKLLRPLKDFASQIRLNS